MSPKNVVVEESSSNLNFWEQEEEKQLTKTMRLKLRKRPKLEEQKPRQSNYVKELSRLR